FSSLTDSSTPQIYTLSLHDALPIFHCDCDLHRGNDFRPLSALDRRRCRRGDCWRNLSQQKVFSTQQKELAPLFHYSLTPLFHATDRKSTRLNSSHGSISYAVFCLKK